MKRKTRITSRFLTLFLFALALFLILSAAAEKTVFAAASNSGKPETVIGEESDLAKLKREITLSFPEKIRNAFKEASGIWQKMAERAKSFWQSVSSGRVSAWADYWRDFWLKIKTLFLEEKQAREIIIKQEFNKETEELKQEIKKETQKAIEKKIADEKQNFWDKISNTISQLLSGFKK